MSAEGSRLPAGGSRLPAAGSRLSAEGSVDPRLSASGSRISSSEGFRLPAASTVPTLGVASSVGYWSALSPLAGRITLPPAKAPSAIVVLGDDDEEDQNAIRQPEERKAAKRPAAADAERSKNTATPKN